MSSGVLNAIPQVGATDYKEIMLLALVQVTVSVLEVLRVRERRWWPRPSNRWQVSSQHTVEVLRVHERRWWPEPSNCWQLSSQHTA